MIVALQTLLYFRASLISALGRLLQPYYQSIVVSFRGNGDTSEEDDDENVFAEFDEEKGVIFFPAVYVQRYAAVTDCLMDKRWCGKLEKVVDFGYHDMSFIKYLKDVPGVHTILGVDLESIPQRCSSDLLGCDDYTPKRENPLQVTLFQGNAADPDYRLIGCDAVIAIEMIEHMLPHDLERFVQTIFGFIKPWVAVITTPNADFNVLFKALGENGLRRWDHLFEWTREQFNNWCSNIVSRYPQYTVSCQGIGPGPPGTRHYGCCSQLALFVSKDYQKQQNLNLNSLAVVTNAPSPEKTSEVLGGLDIQSSSMWLDDDPNLHRTPSSLSFYNTDADKGSLSLVTSSVPSTDSPPTFTYEDFSSQCNLDNDLGKNYMMFDDDTWLEVVVPSRRTTNRVYDIEDVSSRLNCTTLQANKFSKNTLNLMAKNKVDSLLHTREVVDEIRQITHHLNLDKHSTPVNGQHVWYNINWGENAPYWNQYYKIVREFSCPFEAKSEESRILELVSDEINRLIDKHCDEECSGDANRLEIPMSQLMDVVQHITTDLDRVRDVLEWNGYEIANDVLIHSRQIDDVSTTQVTTNDCPETDTLSDCTADIRSTTASDGSTIVPEYHGRRLHRALDNKVRDLRSIMSDDEDIATELDKVVCRLMKLALRTSTGLQAAPPTRWMQCKLLDLLTLTEKAIERRKKNVLETYPFEDLQIDNGIEIPIFDKIKSYNTANQMVDKYAHLIETFDENNGNECRIHFHDSIIEDDISISRKTIKDKDCLVKKSPLTFITVHRVFSTDVFELPEALANLNTSLERTQTWLDGDIAEYQYPVCDIKYNNISSSGDTDNSLSQIKRKPKKGNKKEKATKKAITKLEAALYKVSLRISQSKHRNKNKLERKNKRKKTYTGILKKEARKKSNHNNFVKNSSGQSEKEILNNSSQNSTEHLCINARLSKPIPESLINLCHSEYKEDKGIEEYTALNNMTDTSDEVVMLNINNSSSYYNIADTQESIFIDIITMDNKETLALQRTIGTDAEVKLDISDKSPGDNCNNIIDDKFGIKHQVSAEDLHGQTIFLNDINEPSTSKGVRHNVSMDVQCGPDTFNVGGYPLRSASTSFARLPQKFPTAKIENTVTNVVHEGTEFGTSTGENYNFKLIEPCMRSVGIKIKDSKEDFQTMKETENIMALPNLEVTKVASETKLLKPVSSALKTEVSFGSYSKTCVNVATLSKEPSEILTETISKEDENIVKSSNKLKCPQLSLSCGGVHVHSYNDKNVSEDIVYQGEWQRYRAKPNARRKIPIIIPVRKTIESNSRNKKDCVKEKRFKDKCLPKPQGTKVVFMEIKPTVNIIKKRFYTSKPNITSIDNSNNTTVTSNSGQIVSKIIPRPMKNSKKVALKITTSASKIAMKNMPKRVQKLPTSTEGSNKLHEVKRSYVPLYLRRNCKKSFEKENKSLNKSIDSVDVMKYRKNEQKYKAVGFVTPLVRSNTEEKTKDLFNFSNQLRDNLSYAVFRNELQENLNLVDKNSSNTVKNTSKNKRNPNIRIPSPQSFNSSTCSSPSSIATIRVNRNNNVPNKQLSKTTNKENIHNNDSNKPSSTRTKKVMKRYKKADNKENILTNSVAIGKDTDKLYKSPFVGRSKNVIIGQMTNESNNSLFNSPAAATKKSQADNTVKALNQKRTSSPTLSKNRLLKSTTSSVNEINHNQDFKLSDRSTECSNMVLIVQPKLRELVLEIQESSHSQKDCDIAIETHAESQLPESFGLSASTNDLHIDMRQLVDDLLDVIDSSSDNCSEHIDSKTVILSRTVSITSDIEECDSLHDKTSSLKDTFTEHNDNLNCSMGIREESKISLDTRRVAKDLSLLSFISMTSMSKYSEYFLADSEPEALSSACAESRNASSVQEIFDRKEPHLLEDQDRTLVQEFSGFSVEAHVMTGDQEDSIALVDSETGSLAWNVGRQVTSEEVFISGRSSSSYESCLPEDDSFVPNWLFQMMSQQSSDDDGPVPVAYGPMDQLFDENGNAIEPMLVIGAGAGDGRGIHSDYSQDSSGRGTSLSSSVTSSGPQSEAVILLDPSALAAQFEMLHEEPAASSAMVPAVPNLNDSSDTTFRIVDGERRATTHRESLFLGQRLPSNTASDMDADISSLDTDVPDSS